MSNDPFLQRAIEYWLDSSNELGYQPLFCEWLITQGYILKYSIKNTTLEQGKDVVAIGPDGTPHAYQLKGGDINLTRWRNEVKPEIEALIDCPIVHPDIDKSKNHVSYLVTNGEIEDAVRVEIVALNEKKWASNPLHVLRRGDLLNAFQEMAEGILPKNAQTYKNLIDLIFADGNGFPDIEKINSFLFQILNVEKASLKKEQRRRDIAAAVLYTTMIAAPYRKVQNYASTVRIMVLLLADIFYLVDQYNIEDKYWIESYEIIWHDIITTAKLLESEINTVGFDSSFTPFDTDLIPFRKHTAISVIYPLKLAQLINGDEDWKALLQEEISTKYKSSIALWGEASLVPLIFLALIFKKVDGAQDTINLLKNSILQILTHNGRNSKDYGLLSPYYDLNFAVKLTFGLLEEEFEEKSQLASYFLKPLIEILVRAGERNFIAQYWREISFIHFEEFVPQHSADYYLWRAEKGENLSVVPKKEKSWSELVQEANGFQGKALPSTMKRFPNFLPFFLSMFPHRVNSETLGFLDYFLNKK